MTNLTKAELTAQLAAIIPNNSTQEVSAADMREACTNLNNAIFRSDAIALEDATGRILLEQGGYLLRDF